MSKPYYLRMLSRNFEMQVQVDALSARVSDVAGELPQGSMGLPSNGSLESCFERLDPIERVLRIQKHEISQRYQSPSKSKECSPRKEVSTFLKSPKRPDASRNITSPSTDDTPQMSTPQDLTCCHSCNYKFATGKGLSKLFKRSKVVCGSCKNTVCIKCCGNKAYAPGSLDKKVPVCDLCSAT